MQMLQVVFMLVLFGGVETDVESEPVDALFPEQVRQLISELDDASFQKRDKATKELYSWGQTAVFPLAVAAEEGSVETSIRAFDILQQLYRNDQNVDFEEIETLFQALKRSENLSVATRAQQNLDNNAETRQERAIVQIEKLGGIISFREKGLDRQPLARPTIEYIALSRDWAGGDAGLELLGRIEEIRAAPDVSLYIIRGVQISEESTQNLRAELPFLTIQYRGPARLGVRNSQTSQVDGCLIGQVDPGSAAEVAGLRSGDVVIELDGRPLDGKPLDGKTEDGRSIDNFLKLISIIEKKEPGDRVPIVLRRGGEIQKIVCELQGWTRQPRSSENKSKPTSDNKSKSK